MDRPSWDEYFLGIAEAVASRGTCSRLKVGAVLVGPDKRVLSTGYNGAPRDSRHCDHGAPGGDMEGGHCSRAVHAERNAVDYWKQYYVRQYVDFGAWPNRAVREVVSSAWPETMYVTVPPCANCAALVIETGVKRVVFLDDYRGYAGRMDMIERYKNAGVEVVGPWRKSLTK